METRIIALEEQIMFLERHVSELDGQVRVLSEDLLAARREIAATRAAGAERYEQLMERLENTEADVSTGEHEDSQSASQNG